MANFIFQPDGDYVNFNGGGNLWRLHKNSRLISYHWDETGDLFFDVYDQQYQVKAGDIGNVVIDGNVLTEAADFETYIKTVFPAYNSLSSPTADDIEISDSSKGIILKTSTDRRARITLTEDGSNNLQLTITEI